MMDVGKGKAHTLHVCLQYYFLLYWVVAKGLMMVKKVNLPVPNGWESEPSLTNRGPMSSGSRSNTISPGTPTELVPSPYFTCTTGWP